MANLASTRISTEWRRFVTQRAFLVMRARARAGAICLQVFFPRVIQPGSGQLGLSYRNEKETTHSQQLNHDVVSATFVRIPMVGCSLKASRRVMCSDLELSPTTLPPPLAVKSHSAYTSLASFPPRPKPFSIIFRQHNFDKSTSLIAMQALCFN